MSKLILILMYLVSVSSLTTISLFPKKENIKSNVFKINVMKNLNKLSESVLGFPYELPKLNYSYNDLEPNIDESTMNIHYNKHHGAYVTNLNNALKGSDLEKTPLVELFKNIDKAPVAVRNNGGGHYNHTLFWELLTPKGSEKPEGELAEAIEKQFGGFEKFKELFTDAAIKRFGSGWAWLAIDNQGNLFVSSTPNQDNPLMNVAEKQGIPLIGLDVWEHAYYLKYQNRRLDYINSFWNIINWDIALERYKKVTQ